MPIFIVTLLSTLLQKVFSVLGKFFKKAVISIPLIIFIISLEFFILKEAFNLV